MKLVRLFLVAVFLMGLSHCAARVHIPKESEEAILKRRVQEYWGYMVKGELDKTYFYESPEFREKMNISGYIVRIGRFPLKWESFEIMEVWTSGDEGYIKLNAKYRYLIPHFKEGTFERVIEERWAQKEGQWYHLSPMM